MGAHHGEAGVDDPPLALADLVHRSLHVVVDAAPGNPAQSDERAGVGIEQHFVTLAGIGNQPEGPAGAQLQVGHLQAPVDAADHQPLFAPVKLERLAHLEAERNEGTRHLAIAFAPPANEGGDLAVATGIAVRPDLRVQGLGGAPILFGAVGVRFERLFQRRFKHRQLARRLVPTVLRRRRFLPCPDPPTYRVARQPRPLGDLVQRQLVAKEHPLYLAQYFHGDHLLTPA